MLWVHIQNGTKLCVTYKLLFWVWVLFMKTLATHCGNPRKIRSNSAIRIVAIMLYDHTYYTNYIVAMKISHDVDGTKLDYYIVFTLWNCLVKILRDYYTVTVGVGYILRWLWRDGGQAGSNRKTTCRQKYHPQPWWYRECMSARFGDPRG